MKEDIEKLRKEKELDELRLFYSDCRRQLVEMTIQNLELRRELEKINSEKLSP